MGGGRCLLTILLILPLSTPNILLLHTPNNLENLVDVEIETAADSVADVIEQDGFEILGGFGYSNSLADFEFPVVYKDIVNMEVVDVIDDNFNPSVDIKHILSEQNLVAVKSEELATEILEKVEIETAASETENDEESDKNMDEVVDLFKDKNKEEYFEFVKNAEENTDEENHLEDVPSETEIKDTESDDDEESAVVEEYVNKESDKNMEEVVDLFKDKNKEEDFEFVKDAEENADEENHLEDVPTETEIKDAKADDDVKDEESAVVEEYVTNESDKSMEEVVDLFKYKNKEEDFEFVKDAEENTDEENHLEDVPTETEIKDTKADDHVKDEESAVVEDSVTKESDKRMEEVVDLFKDKNKEEDLEFVKDAEENTDEENHVLRETEIKDTETADDVKDKESAVVEEYVTKIANLPEDVSTEIMSESEPVSQKSDIEFMNEKQREEKVIIIHAGNYEEEDFNNFNPKMTVLASSTDHRIEEEAKHMEMNDNLNIKQEEDEMKTLQAISCAEAFKEQIIIVTIFIRCIVMRI